MVGGKGDDQLLLGEWTWCHCWVPLQGAIVVCYSVGGGDDQLWGSGRGAMVVVCNGWGEGDDQL